MLDCRYYDLCCFTDDSCNGEQECPKRGHCQFYKPMPDINALLELADGLEKDADNIISAARNAQFTGSGPRMEEAKHDAYEWRQISSRIRDALGVDK